MDYQLVIDKFGDSVSNDESKNKAIQLIIHNLLKGLLMWAWL